MSLLDFWKQVRTEKETGAAPTAGYGHGPGGIFSGPGAAGGVVNAMQSPGGRRGRKKKKTTKEIVIAVSQNGGPPTVATFPDPAPVNDAVGTYDDAEPCPYCGVFLTLPPEWDTAWFQCPNCGESLYADTGDEDYIFFTADDAGRLFGATPPADGVPMALMSPVNDGVTPAAVQYKAVSLALAALKANYNAKAGETIQGNLARGGDGKFASGGGAGKDALGTDQASLDEVKKRVEAMHEPKPKGGKGKAAPKPKKGKAAPKGKKAKPTPDEKQAAKDKMQEKNLNEIFSDDGANEALTNVRDDSTTVLSPEYQTLLESQGFIKSSNGFTTLTPAGRALMNAAAADNTKAMNIAVKRGKVTAKVAAAKKADSDQKKTDRAAALRDKADAIEAKKEFSPSATDDAGSMAVFKQADGRYRWITFTSSSFKDKDRETVSQAALERDVERADATGDFGPLRWFHVPGADIGDCDFNVMVGRVLLESGTFRNDLVGEKLAEFAPELEVSAGFLHPITEPDADGVFHNIRRFERSLLPKGKAANLLTQFFVKENSMASFEEKLKSLAGYLGGGPAAETIVNTLVSQAEAATKAATDAGITFKAAGDASAPEGSDAEEAAETPEEEAAEDQYVGDLTVEEFTKLITGILAGHSAAMNSNVATKEDLSAVRDEVNSVRAEIAAPVAAATKAAGELTALNTSVGQVASRLAQAEKSINDLVGDQPRIVRGYVASQSDENVVTSAIKSGPIGDDIDLIAAKVAASYGG